MRMLVTASTASRRRSTHSRYVAVTRRTAGYIGDPKPFGRNSLYSPQTVTFGVFLPAALVPDQTLRQFLRDAE
jgi:hypothetical protein